VKSTLGADLGAIPVNNSHRSSLVFKEKKVVSTDTQKAEAKKNGK
jgi:hypothetical protein